MQENNNQTNDNSHYEEQDLFISEELKQSADLSSQVTSTENKSKDKEEIGSTTDDNTCYIVHLYFDKFNSVDPSKVKEEDKLQIVTMNVTLQNIDITSVKRAVTLKFTLFSEVLRSFMERHKEGVVLEKITVNDSNLKEVYPLFNSRFRINSYFFSTSSEVPGLLSLTLSSECSSTRFF